MFRFTIRELLLLTVIVAMGVGWWIDRSRLQHTLDWVCEEAIKVQESRSEYLRIIREMHGALQSWDDERRQSAAERSRQRAEKGRYK